MLFQLFLIGFALFLLLHVERQYRARKVNLGWLALWALFAAGVVVVAVVPQITDRLADVVGVGRGADLVIYTSLAFLFVSVLRLTMRAHRQETELTEIVRKIAVDRAETPVQKV